MDFIARFIGSAVILGTALGTVYLVSQKIMLNQRTDPLEALKEAYVATVMSPFFVHELMTTSTAPHVQVFVNSKLM